MAEDCKYEIERSNLYQVRKQVTDALCDIDKRINFLDTNVVHKLYGLDDSGVNQHDDVDIIEPSKTGSALVYVEAADGGTDKFQSLNVFVAAGYGGIGVDAPSALPNLGATWVPLTGFDLELIATPLNVIQYLPNNALGIESEGVWQVGAKVSLTFAELNAGREMSLRLFNINTATPSPITFNFFVGRNQAGANLSFTLNIDIDPVNVDDLYMLEIGGGDIFTGVTNIGTTYQMNHVSQFEST